MKAKDYDIGEDKKGRKRFKCVIDWYNEDGEKLRIETKDVEYAETVIGLMTGTICLADLEP